MLSDLELLTLQTETLFVQNKAKRLLYINEPERPEAPRFFLGRTKKVVICRFRDDVPQTVVEQLEEVVAKEPGTLGEESDRLEVYKDILRQHGPVQTVESGPAYRFPDELQTAPNVVTITEANADLLDEHFAEWKAALESVQPCVAVIQENLAVSLCCSSRTSHRISPGAAEAGLETAPAFRGRGYAASVVLGWAAEVRKQGRIPLYSTAWENEASRAVARKAGPHRVRHRLSHHLNL